MSRAKKATGKPIQHGNCVTKQLSSQRQNDLKQLAKVKDREKGKKFKLVPIEGSIRAFKLVEIC